MTSASRPTSPARQRRAERRQATYDEMLSLARAALRTGRPVSLRAIAADMGLTAPALYRYVDSHAALERALSASILDDVMVDIREAADRWPAERPGHRLASSLSAFRCWALSRPEEFRLVFGTNRGAGGAQGPAEEIAGLEDTSPATIRFVGHFMGCLAAMHRHGRIEANDDQVPPTARAGLRRLEELCAEQGVPVDAPAGVWWQAVSQWMVLCGVIRMEVDGLPSGPLVADGAVFRQAVALCAQAGGVPAENATDVVDETLVAC